MKDQAKSVPSISGTQAIAVQLPHRIIERATKYAEENGNSITGVLIEALDTFLRNQDMK
ncbi:MAG: hypothetical protein PVG51_04620 [Desulfosarcina sp.]|jgi:hypothetical protein